MDMKAFLGYLKDDKGDWSAKRIAIATSAALVTYSTISSLTKKRDPFGGNVQNPKDFGGFLRNNDVPLPAPAKKVYIPSAFDTHLKNAGATATATATAAAVPNKDPYLEGLPAKGFPILILFGTEYGFSKEIAMKLAQTIKDVPQGQFIPQVLDMADYGTGYADWTDAQVILTVCSTQGDGVPPSEARDFVEWLDAAPALPKTPFSVLALGDTNYEHYCACGKRIDAALEKLGGTRAVPRVDVDREDWAAVDGWIAAVVADLKKRKLVEKPNPHLLLSSSPSSSSNDQKKKKRYTRAKPYLATVSAKRGLCKLSHKDDKNTFMVEFDLGDSGIEYLPGDALGIVPVNGPTYVDALLAALGQPGDVSVTLPDGGSSVGLDASSSSSSSSSSGVSVSLREALLRYYDLRQPKLELLKALAEAYPPEDRDQYRDSQRLLRDLAASKAKAEAYLEDRHVIDVLREHAGAAQALGFARVLAFLKPLQARLYSISSSMRESRTKVQATIAEVKYEAHGEERIGVCSTFCGERISIGQKVLIFVSKNPDFRLPQDPTRPIIMVGPGTGLAPFRSFVKERTLSGVPSGEAVLFFGCRRSDQDFLYGDLLEAWHREGAIKLHTAFSRQTSEKVYVQDRIREATDEIWRLLATNQCHVYICGDASRMAVDVEKVLLEVIRKKKGVNEKQARAELDNMAKEGRYQKDVWF